MTFTTLDLSPLGKAGAFGDAVWKDHLGTGSDFTFCSVPFNLMKPSATADLPFAIDLPAGTWTEAAVVFAVDEVNPEAIPFATVTLTAAGKSGDVVIDLRNGDGPTGAPEVGRILRGPSGKLHFPVKMARIPLHPEAVAAAEGGGKARLEFSVPEGMKSSLTIAAITMIARPPLVEVKDGFEISCDINLDNIGDDEDLFAADRSLKIILRDAVRNPAPGEYDGNGGNYLNFTMPDGACPVVEALLPGPCGRVGIPLGVLANPSGTHHLRVVRNRTYFVIELDGHRDEDFPIGPLFWPKDSEGEALSPRLGPVSFRTGIADGVVPPSVPSLQNGFHAMYWSPAGHNQWAGDVVTTTWDDKLHIFYLVDRRHHNSKGGRGGHWFEHIVSGDLKSWQELPAAVPMDVREEYVGTGTPFMLDGKYCLAYGLHTTRHCSYEEVVARGLPFGGTYSVSDDGIHFKKTGIVFTDDQNPSVYNRPDGLLGMGCIDSLQKASSIMGPWTREIENAHVHGDCPCPFEWNGLHYIIQGFCTMSRSRTGENGTYEDEVLAGYDIYEGLSVPMVAPWKDNRRILAGWINHRNGWGGWLCFRELVQYPDGHLGTRWVGEMPMPVEPLEFECEPGKVFTLKFSTDDKAGRDFAFILDPVAGKASFTEKADDGTYPEVPTYAELAAKYEPEFGEKRIGAGRQFRPDEAGDFAIGKIRGLDKPFKVRVENYFDKKAGISLVDIEIAGHRTMVTRRFGAYTIA